MSPTKRRLIITLATLLLVAMAPAVVMAAGGTFTDDDDSIFEDHIEWMASAGVTAGCNPPTNDNYCPTDNVNRGQMAAFMRRFAQYIGAEDGTPAEADHATSADTATTADSATNAGTVDGKNAVDFQPALFDFESNSGVSVSGSGDYLIATGEVDTAAAGFCLIGASPQSDILIRATGWASGVGAGETASFWIYDDTTPIGETTRRVTENDGSFAMEWYYEGGGGTETFHLYADEAGGDVYTVTGQITVEVLQDTRCEGGGIIIFPTPPAVSADEM